MCGYHLSKSNCKKCCCRRFGLVSKCCKERYIMQFDIYELLNSNERESLNEIVLEACSRNGYDPNEIDYDIQGTIITIM